MDQELSKGMWSGAGLMMTVGVVAVAVLLFGIIRVFGNNTMNGVGKTVQQSNREELIELNGATTTMSIQAAKSLLERNASEIYYIKILYVKNNRSIYRVTSYIPKTNTVSWYAGALSNVKDPTGLVLKLALSDIDIFKKTHNFEPVDCTLTVAPDVNDPNMWAIVITLLG